ncbi:MAG: hypothetical protein ACRD2X_14310 [Vicinamibacteraceae bacterium]
MSMIKRLGVLACVCLAGAGCGGGAADTDTSAAAEAPASNGAAAPAGDEDRSACDLITAEEASQILGSTVVSKETENGDRYYAPAAGAGLESQEFILKVQWTGGQEAWDINQQSTALAGKLLGGDKSGATDVAKSKEAPLGDKSIYNPILGGYVLKGDVLLQFDNLMRVKDAQSKWEQLARKALARL